LYILASRADISKLVSVLRIVFWRIVYGLYKKLRSVYTEDLLLDKPKPDV
jgi:hypothetical protein